MSFTKIMTQITAILKINDISSATREFVIKDLTLSSFTNFVQYGLGFITGYRVFSSVRTDHRGSVIITCASILSQK
jgi:hypothetical protein